MWHVTKLVPYEIDGDMVKAWLYTALRPRRRDSFGVLLFLSIDTANAGVAAAVGFAGAITSFVFDRPR